MYHHILFDNKLCGLHLESVPAALSKCKQCSCGIHLISDHDNLILKMKLWYKYLFGTVYSQFSWFTEVLNVINQTIEKVHTMSAIAAYFTARSAPAYAGRVRLLQSRFSCLAQNSSFRTWSAVKGVTDISRRINNAKVMALGNKYIQKT